MHRDVVHLAVCSNATGFLVTGSEDGHVFRQRIQSILVFGRRPEFEQIVPEIFGFCARFEVKFWKKQYEGIEFVKHYRAHLGQTFPGELPQGFFLPTHIFQPREAASHGHLAGRVM